MTARRRRRPRRPPPPVVNMPSAVRSDANQHAHSTALRALDDARSRAADSAGIRRILGARDAVLDKARHASLQSGTGPIAYAAGTDNDPRIRFRDQRALGPPRIVGV